MILLCPVFIIITSAIPVTTTPVLLQLLSLLLIPNFVHSLRILDTVVSCDQVPLDGCETTYNPDGNLENAVIIQENPLFVDETDKKYLLTCVPILSTTLRFLSETVNFGGITVDSQAITAATISATGIADQHLQYKVELHKVNSDGILQPINGPIFVGDDIVYIIRVRSLTSDARIGHCWARDEQSTLQLSDDNGCSIQLIGNVWNHFQREEVGSDIIFRNQIKAWAFPTSNDVNVFCNLHTCRVTCQHISCNEQRQRRNSTDSNNNDNNNNNNNTTITTTTTTIATTIATTVTTETDLLIEALEEERAKKQ
ncbi:Shc-transforming protein 1 [Dirofilaria immitis]|nr:Shc-transforming protein 1 [Dirofilaria immitis]